MIVIGKKYKFNEIELNKLKHLDIRYIEPNIEKIEEAIKNNNFEFIVLNTDYTDENLIKYLTSLELNGAKFLTIEHFLEKYLGKIYIPKDGSKITFLEEIKPFSKIQYLIKRIIDFSIAIPLGILTSPIMLYSAYRIKKESPDGEVFFKQTRIGKNKKPFTCYKFRSMRTDVKFFDHYTQENDPRIFKWGAIMRKTRIDELPQLFNVIKGDLHIIGPRAEWDELVKNMKKSAHFIICVISTPLELAAGHR